VSALLRGTNSHHQAIESTRFPNGDVICMLLENACRKLERLAAPPLPPKSVINVLKLVCNELSAVVVPLAAVLMPLAAAAVELVEVPEMDWIKLLTSAENCELLGPPQRLAASVLDAALVVVSCDCDLRAAMRLCKKFCNA
jgi:hypothetical protein